MQRIVIKLCTNVVQICNSNIEIYPQTSKYKDNNKSLLQRIVKGIFFRIFAVPFRYFWVSTSRCKIF